MRKILVLCLFAFCLANAAKQSLAVMPCVGNFDAEGLERLRDKLEEVARDVLPSADFRLIPYKDVLQEVGDEDLFNACAEQGVCFGNLTAQVNADYGAWCKVNKYSGKLILKFELYSVGEKDLIYTREYDNYNPKNLDDMIKIMKKEVPIAIREKVPGVVKADDPSRAKLYEKPDTMLDTEPIKTSFWVGLGLEVLGAGLIGVALYENSEMNAALDKYKVRGNSVDYYDSNWKDVDSSKNTRNMLYVIGGLVLASGIGVHIWF